MLMDVINFVFFTFGDKVNLGRTVLAVHSLLITNRWLSKSNSNLIIYTDSLDYFKDKFDEYSIAANIVLIHLSEDKILEMRGPLDFVHRIKICLIQQTFERFDGTVLYLDSDMLVTADLYECLEKLQEGSSLMHQFEYLFSSYRFNEEGTIEREFYDYYSKDSIIIENKNYSYNELVASYNAGVIGLVRSQYNLLVDVFSVTDILYSSVKHHACEQFAFSLVLQTNTELHTCQSEVYHYWHRVKKKIVDENMEVLLNEIKQRPNPETILEIKKYVEQHFEWNQWLLFHYYDARRYADGDKILLNLLLAHPIKVIKVYKDILYHWKKRFRKS